MRALELRRPSRRRVPHLDGHSSELSGILSQRDSSLDLPGVVLAGVIIEALGVLADTGITQASAVLALRQAIRASGSASSTAQP